MELMAKEDREGSDWGADVSLNVLRVGNMHVLGSEHGKKLIKC